MDKSEGTFVIGWSFSKDNQQIPTFRRDTLIIMQGGRYDRMKVINAFYDEDAHDIYEKLIGDKENSK